jgi:hypothetical protein
MLKGGRVDHEFLAAQDLKYLFQTTLSKLQSPTITMKFSFFAVATGLMTINAVSALGINCRGSPASAGACDLNDLIAAATRINPNKVIVLLESGLQKLSRY